MPENCHDSPFVQSPPEIPVLRPQKTAAAPTPSPRHRRRRRRRLRVWWWNRFSSSPATVWGDKNGVDGLIAWEWLGNGWMVGKWMLHPEAWVNDSNWLNQSIARCLLDNALKGWELVGKRRGLPLKFQGWDHPSPVGLGRARGGVVAAWNHQCKGSAFAIHPGSGLECFCRSKGFQGVRNTKHSPTHLNITWISLNQPCW